MTNRKPRLSKVGLEDIERLVVYYTTWIESIAVADSIEIEPKMLIPTWEWLRDHYPGDELKSWPEDHKKRVRQVAERTWHLTSQDIFMPDFVNAACLFFIVSDCRRIMEGDEFRQANHDRQEGLKKFAVIATTMLSLSKGQMIQAYVQAKYNRKVREGSKEWHSTNREIQLRFDKAFQAWRKSID